MALGDFQRDSFTTSIAVDAHQPSSGEVYGIVNVIGGYPNITDGTNTESVESNWGKPVLTNSIYLSRKTTGSAEVSLTELDDNYLSVWLGDSDTYTPTEKLQLLGMLSSNASPTLTLNSTDYTTTSDLLGLVIDTSDTITNDANPCVLSFRKV